jgi:hypothetical protein
MLGNGILGKWIKMYTPNANGSGMQGMYVYRLGMMRWGDGWGSWGRTA